MDLEELSLKSTSLLRKAGLAGIPRPAVVGICILGLAVICAGAWHFWPHPNENFTVVTSSATQETTRDEATETTTTGSTTLEIVVDVEGSVKAPGLYTLTKEARVGDAVNSAGGFSADASRGSINLAQKLSDGEQIYVPSINDETAPTREETPPATPAYDKNGEKVNINTAGAEELQKLSGIGPSLSERIVDYRESNGKFKSIDELKNVSGIGETRFANLKDKICI